MTTLTSVCGVFRRLGIPSDGGPSSIGVFPFRCTPGGFPENLPAVIDNPVIAVVELALPD